jgi:2-iminoacetate synthase
MGKGGDFIDDWEIWGKLERNSNPEPRKVRDILQKSLAVETLRPDETATLLNVEDEGLWEEMFETAGRVKRKVCDNRIVTFAPLYCSNFCVNNCLYCAFRRENHVEKRRKLTLEEVKDEAWVLAGEIGHKRIIVVYGGTPDI